MGRVTQPFCSVSLLGGGEGRCKMSTGPAPSAGKANESVKRALVPAADGAAEGPQHGHEASAEGFVLIIIFFKHVT